MTFILEAQITMTGKDAQICMSHFNYEMSQLIARDSKNCVVRVTGSYVKKVESAHGFEALSDLRERNWQALVDEKKALSDKVDSLSETLRLIHDIAEEVDDDQVCSIAKQALGETV